MFVNGASSRARSDTKTMSQWASMVKPRPTAAPFTAASNGFGNSCSTSTNAGNPLRDGAVAIDAGVDGLRHLQEIGARTERLAGTGEHDDRDVVVGCGGAQRVGGRVVQLLVERIGAVGPVEGEQPDAIAVFGDQHGGSAYGEHERDPLDRFVAHGPPLVVGPALHDGFARAEHDRRSVGQGQLEASRQDDVDVDGRRGVPPGLAGIVAGGEPHRPEADPRASRFELPPAFGVAALLGRAERTTRLPQLDQPSVARVERGRAACRR